MAQMTIDVDLGGVIERATQLMERGQFAFINQVYADANMYAPLKTSDMRNQSQISADMKQIVWNTPYARRQFYNQFSNYTTPGTGPRWDLKAKSIHMQSWQRIVEVAMR